MNHTLSVSESLYERLQAEARRRGLTSIETLLEVWQAENDALRQRREVVAEITTLQEQLYQKYGEMPDSVDLVRDDRGR